MTYWARFRNPWWWGLVVFCGLDFVSIFIPLAGLWILTGLLVPRIGHVLVCVLRKAGYGYAEMWS